MANRHNENDETTEETFRFTRRSYLQFAGAAVGSLATVGSMTESAAALTPTVDIEDGDDIAPILSDISDGETVVLPQGTYELRGDVAVSADDFTFHGNGSVVKTYEGYGHRLRLEGTNYEFSHLAFDPQNEDDDDVWVTLWPYGADWHVHHLAWLKEKRVSADKLGSSIRPGVYSGSEGNLTDIWLGAGVGPQDGNSHIHCFGSVDDDLWIRRTYFYQGAVYGANSSSERVRNEGTTHFEDCYFENCYNTCARTGGHYQDTYIRNCVMNCSDLDDVPSKPSYSTSYFRGVWAWHGPVILEDVHINGEADRALAVEDRQIVQESYIDYRSGAFTGSVQHPDKVQIDSSVGSDPKTTPPSACVTTAEEAYVGATDDPGTDGTTTHTIEITGTGTPTNYEFTVSDTLTAGDNTERWDLIDGTSVSGWVTEPTHVDTYEYTGEITAFDFSEGDAVVRIDGEEVDPATIVEPVTHTIEIEGTGSPANYEFTVSDTLTAGGDLEQWDVIDGTTAAGWVTETTHVDTYEYTGDITAFTLLEGDTVVRIDGEQIDPATIV